MTSELSFMKNAVGHFGMTSCRLENCANALDIYSFLVPKFVMLAL